MWGVARAGRTLTARGTEGTGAAVKLETEGGSRIAYICEDGSAGRCSDAYRMSAVPR